jgi:hypothetical protein
MTNQRFLILFLVLLSISGFSATKVENPPCESTKEFITSFEFLRSEKEMSLSGDISLKYATEVAKGCSGAAKRFIQTMTSLRKTDLGLTDVLEASQEIAKKDDATAEVFNGLFRKLYAQDGYDLDLKSSLELAKSLSLNFPGNAKTGLDDFDQVSAFCIGKRSLDLPIKQCAELSQRIALLGGKHETSVGSKFIESFQYLTKANGIGLPVKDALVLGEELLQKHPLAFTNFKQAYEYAISSSGMNADKKSAIAFAQKMADATLRESKAE